MGLAGNRAVFFSLPSIVKQTQADLVIVNGENASPDGLGILAEQFHRLREAGVDVVTTGNHVWEQSETRQLLKNEGRLLRPANYPAGLEGSGSCLLEKNGVKVAVMNFQGRTRMPLTDDPFICARDLVRKVGRETKLIFIDFHAEATDEKEAFGFFLDGQVSAVVGTHTHIQTADEKILPQGTAYMSDLGMCGPQDSVIGGVPQISVDRALTLVPLKNMLLDAPAEIRGALVRVDPATGRALSIERIDHKTP